MPAAFFPYATLTIGLVPSLFGLHALIRPASVTKAFGLAFPTQPEARKATATFVRIYGIRNIAVSYLLTLIWSTGDRRLMAASSFAALAMCIGDGLLSKVVLGGGEWNHWFLAPVIAGVQAGLMGWI